MRDQREINVSTVRTHSIDAARRNGGTGRLDDFENERGEPEQPGWKKYFKWEDNLTVANRTIEKGWVVPQPLGIALCIILIGGVGGLYWRIIDKQVESDKEFTQKLDKQNELLIRLDQALIDKEKHDNSERREIKEKQELHALLIQNLKDKLLVADARRGK